MADLDSKAKRFSGIHVSMPWRSLLPDSDGSFNQGDRQHLILLYSGILAGEAAAAFMMSMVLPYAYTGGYSNGE